MPSCSCQTCVHVVSSMRSKCSTTIMFHNLPSNNLTCLPSVWAMPLMQHALAMAD